MARPESVELATIDDCSAAISTAHERIALVLTRSADRLTRMDIAELTALDDDLERLHQYLLVVRTYVSSNYQQGVPV